MRTFQDTLLVRKQILDGNQLQKLSLTLGRTRLWPDMESIAHGGGDTPHIGTPLPPGYHLIYFTPGELERDLGGDGSDRTFNPPAPFTRRMWHVPPTPYLSQEPTDWHSRCCSALTGCYATTFLGLGDACCGLVGR